jgi:transcription antitermination protein NusB
MSTRREAREVAMQALYAFELGGGEASHILETIVKERLGDDREGIEFATRLFLRTLDRLVESDRLIERHTENWDLSRIALIDRIVLRMAICEFRGFEDIPPKVTINEAIEVVKKYSTERSGQFVNGILDAILAELRTAGELKKKGRGLVGMDNTGERSPGE